MNKSSVAIIGALLILWQQIPARAADKATPPADAVAPAKVDLTDAKQLAAVMKKAGQLQKDKKYAQARVIYQDILAANPKGPAASAARFEIARSLKGEGKIAQAAPFLEKILADRADSSPAVIDSSRAMLAEARMAVAADFTKANQFDAAIAALGQIVDDKRFTDPEVRGALLAIAANQRAVNRTGDAIKTYRTLLGKPETGDEERLDDIVALTAISPSSVGELDAYLKSHPATSRANIIRAHLESGRAYWRLKQPDKATAAFDAVLAIERTPFASTREALIGKADVAMLKNDRAGAVAIYRDLLRRPVKTANGEYGQEERMHDIERLIWLAPDSDVTEEVAAYLSHLQPGGSVRLSSAAPKNDVLYFMQVAAKDLPEALERYAQYLRQTTGRATWDDVGAVKAQLTKGGAGRPFVTSDFSKAVAKRISGDAPMGDFLRPLLSGAYQAAANAAWRRARLAWDESDRNAWISVTCLAIACQDQYRGGRATAFWKWVYPDAADTSKNPVKPDALADYLDQSPLPYQPSAKDVAAAAAHLNTLKFMSAFNEDLLVSRALPDNDVLLLINDAKDAERRYRIYLWRTAGRFTAAQLAAVATQLAKGGSDRPFVVSDQSKKLASLISDKAPLGGYLKLLLTGDYQGAARFAWKNARAANSSFGYESWIEPIAIAVRLNDQTIGGRESEFRNWTKGTLKGPDGRPVKANPLAEFLGN